MSYAWPDLIILVAAAISAQKGWKRGFVAELAGMIAIAVAIAAAIFYRGFWDRSIMHFTRLGPGSAHVLAMSLFSLLAYTLVALIAYLLSRFAKAPVIGPVNAAGGSVVGVAKAILLFWVILYIALFFPLSPDLRGDLRRSFLIPIITEPNKRVDAAIRPALPWFVLPFSGPMFRRHRL